MSNFIIKRLKQIFKKTDDSDARRGDSISRVSQLKFEGERSRAVLKTSNGKRTVATFNNGEVRIRNRRRDAGSLGVDITENNISNIFRENILVLKDSLQLRFTDSFIPGTNFSNINFFIAAEGDTSGGTALRKEANTVFIENPVSGGQFLKWRVGNDEKGMQRIGGVTFLSQTQKDTLKDEMLEDFSDFYKELKDTYQDMIYMMKQEAKASLNGEFVDEEQLEEWIQEELRLFDPGALLKEDPEDDLPSYVLTRSTGFHEDRDQDSAVLYRFKKGDIVELLEAPREDLNANGGWWNVRYQGRTGFVKWTDNRIEKLVPFEVNESVALFEEPNEDSLFLLDLNVNDKVLLVENDPNKIDELDWAFVVFEGIPGWVEDRMNFDLAE